MANKVLCMNLGQDIVRCAEIQTSSKTLTITKVFTFDVPEEATRDGKVRVSDEIVTAIRAGLISSDITAKDVYFTVESTRILFKSVEIPKVAKNMIQSTLELSFGDMFNVDETLYHISYVLRGTYKKNEKDIMALEVFAVPNDISESYYNLAVALELNPKSISDTSHSVMTLLSNEFQNRNIATVNIEEATSSLAIVVNGEMVFNKTISQGISPAIESVKHNLKQQDVDFNSTECIEKLYTENILMDKLPDAVLSKDVESVIRYDATSSLSKLIKTIETTFTQFLGKEQIQIQEFIVTGLGAGVANISKLMSREFGIPVKIIQQGNKLKIHKNIASEVLLLSTFPLAGGINDGTNFFTKDEQAGGNVARNKKIDSAVLLGGIAVGLISAAFGFTQYMSAKEENEKAKQAESVLEGTIENLRSLGIEEEYEAYAKAYSYNEEIKNLYLETESLNKDMTVFLTELEQKVPIGAVVTSIKMVPTSAEISFACKDNNTAAGTLHLLRNMKTINSMDCRGVGDNGQGQISFTCSFLLKTSDELTVLFEEDTEFAENMNAWIEADKLAAEEYEDYVEIPDDDSEYEEYPEDNASEDNAPIYIDDEGGEY